MTFIKYLLWKLKTTSSNYWMLLGLKIFVRLLGITTMFYFLNALSYKVDWDTIYFYKIISTLFYLLFFIFLDWYLKVYYNKDLNSIRLKWLNVLRWVPFLFCIILLYLTEQLNNFSWPLDISAKIIYAYAKVWPTIFVPNLSFLIITVLIFYASAILNRNRQLKEENDLTI